MPSGKDTNNKQFDPFLSISPLLFTLRVKLVWEKERNGNEKEGVILVFLLNLSHQPQPFLSKDLFPAKRAEGRNKWKKCSGWWGLFSYLLALAFCFVSLFGSFAKRDETNESEPWPINKKKKRQKILCPSFWMKRNQKEGPCRLTLSSFPLTCWLQRL